MDRWHQYSVRRPNPDDLSATDRSHPERKSWNWHQRRLSVKQGELEGLIRKWEKYCKGPGGGTPVELEIGTGLVDEEVNQPDYARSTGGNPITRAAQAWWNWHISDPILSAPLHPHP